MCRIGLWSKLSIDNLDFGKVLTPVTSTLAIMISIYSSFSRRKFFFLFFLVFGFFFCFVLFCLLSSSLKMLMKEVTAPFQSQYSELNANYTWGQTKEGVGQLFRSGVLASGL